MNLLLEALHLKASHHRQAVADSDRCGCFYCVRTYPATDIKQWVRSDRDDRDLTCAVCPYCGVDSVLPDDTTALSIDLLREMHEYWFREAS